MTTLKIHVGFHKTGTTSIQKYLSENAVHYGYFYPNCERTTLGLFNHLGLSKMKLDEIADELIKISCIHPHVFVSSEELFIKFTDGSFEEFSQFNLRLSKSFSSVEWICTLRNVEDILCSAIREYMESSGFDCDTLSGFCSFYFSKMNHFLKYVTNAGCDFKIVRHSDIPVGSNLIEHFCNSIFSRSTPVEDVRFNLTNQKQLTSVFMSVIRSIYSGLLKKDMYSDDVREATELVISGLKFDPDIEELFEHDLNKYIRDLYNESSGLIFKNDNYDLVRG